MWFHQAVLAHIDAVEAEHYIHRSIDPKHAALQRAVACDDAPGHFVLFPSGWVNRALLNATREVFHQIQLDGAEVRRDGGQELRRHRHPQCDDTFSLAIGNSPETRQRKRIALLQQTREGSLARGSHFAEERGVFRKTDAQSGELAIMNRMRLCREDPLRLLHGDTGGKCVMRGGDVRRDIRNHIRALLDILMQKIGAQLGIQDSAGQKHQRDDQQNRNNRDKKISDNQTVAQTPQQAVSPPANETEEQIDTSENSEVLEEVRRPAADPQQRKNQSGSGHYGANQVKPREAIPNFSEVSAEECHRAVNGNNTLPDLAKRMQSKRLTVRRQAERQTSLACCKEVLLWLRVAYAAVVAAICEINYQADHQPADKASPVDPAEVVHHVAT